MQAINYSHAKPTSAIGAPLGFNKTGILSLSQSQALPEMAGAMGRAVMVFAGVVLCLAAFGLWLVPEAVSNPESQVIRAGLTCLFVGVGFALFHKGRDVPPAIEVELDLQRAELRHIARASNGAGRVVMRAPLADLTFERADSATVVALTAKGEEVLSLPAADAERILPERLTERLAA